MRRLGHLPLLLLIPLACGPRAVAPSASGVVVPHDPPPPPAATVRITADGRLELATVDGDEVLESVPLELAGDFGHRIVVSGDVDVREPLLVPEGATLEIGGALTISGEGSLRLSPTANIVFVPATD